MKYGTFSIEIINSETVQAIAYSQETQTLAVAFYDSIGRFYHKVDVEVFKQLIAPKLQVLDIWNALDCQYEFTPMSQKERLVLLGASL